MRVYRTAVTMALIVFLLTLSGCAYVNTKTPLDQDLDQTTLGQKTGTAEAYSVLWMVAWGDASYAKAAQNGGITTLRHADQEVFTVFFGLYARYRVVVYGD